MMRSLLGTAAVLASLVRVLPAQSFMHDKNVSSEALSMFRGDSPYSLFITIGLVLVLYFVINFIMLAWLKNDQYARTGKALSAAQKWTVPFFGIIDVLIYMRKRPQGDLSLCFHCGKQKLRNSDICYFCGQGDIDHQRHKGGGRRGGATVTAAMNKAASGEKGSAAKADKAGSTQQQADGVGEEKDGSGNGGTVYEPDPAEQLRAAAYTIEGMPDAAILLAKTGIIEAVNEPFEKLTGYEQDDAKGKNVKVFLPTLFKHEKNAEVLNKLKLAVGREYPFSVNAVIHTANDEKLDVIFSMAYLKDAIGQPLHGLITLHDISVIRKEEEQEHDRFYAALTGTAGIVATMISTKDSYTADHQKRVGKLAYAIAKHIGMDEEAARGTYIAGLIHDAGMYRVSNGILNKPEKLTTEEYDAVKQHPVYGYELLKDVQFPWPVATAVLQHHERLNGSGYPSGLPNKDIITEAKIIMVADVVEAMSHKRPYRGAHDLQTAMQTVRDGKGVLYEPKIVDACIKVLNASLNKQ